MEGKKKELLYAAVIFLQKFATATADIMWLVLLAELVGEVMPENGNPGDMGKMAQYVLGLILLSVWKRMGYSFGRVLTLKLQNMVRLRLNCQMVEKTAKIPYRLLEDYTFCGLKQSLKENIGGNADRSFVWFTVQKSGNFMMYCVRILGMSLLLAWASIPLGILFLLLEICHCLMTALGTGQRDFSVKENSPEKRYMEELALGQAGAEERSLFAYAGYIAEKYRREAEIARRSVLSRILEHRKMELANQTLLIIAYVLVETGLAALMMEGRISLGYFIALSIGGSSLIQKNEEGDALDSLQRGKSFIRQWNRFMDLPEMEPAGKKDGHRNEEKDGNRKKSEKGNEEKDGERKKSEKGNEEKDGERHGDRFETLEFRKVSFRYPRTGRYVLHDLSFKLTEGGYYAFVGANGSGKTTIVKLLSGLYDNYEGKILLNGIELRKIPFQERRRMIAVLFQDAARYEDTIIQNILPGAESVYDTGGSWPTGCSESGPALRQKNQKSSAAESDGAGLGNGCEERDPASVRRQLAEDLVREWEYGRSNRFPQGADTFLGSMEENGVMLSRGEWQQLLIARELAQPARLRVMDEPMASLDIFRQGRVCEQFMRDAGKCTTILFSHHMAAVREAKRIFVLKEGTIAEEGSHDRLMGEGGLYAQMYETQRQGCPCS